MLGKQILDNQDLAVARPHLYKTFSLEEVGRGITIAGFRFQVSIHSLLSISTGFIRVVRRPIK